MQYRFLTGNVLKILAAIFMTIDHIGVMLFPRVRLLRIIGRLALPIFAFMIAEGCKYTRNRLKYFGTVFGLGAVCQTVYWFVDGSLYFSILITFSLSIALIYAMQNHQKRQDALSFLVFIGAIAALWWLNWNFTIDYGFWGCMLPAFAAIPNGTERDSNWKRVLYLGWGLLILAWDLGGIQYWSLLALPLLLCYSGQRGKANLKYFFYIFYPLHLVVLEGIAMLIHSL